MVYYSLTVFTIHIYLLVYINLRQYAALCVAVLCVAMEPKTKVRCKPVVKGTELYFLILRMLAAANHSLPLSVFFGQALFSNWT